MEPFAILSVEPASMAWAPSAGNIALMVSVMTVLSAINLRLMVAVSVTQFGMKTSVIARILTSAVKNGVLFGILNAEQISTMLLAASAHLTALLDKRILVFHVLRTPMVAEPVHP